MYVNNNHHYPSYNLHYWHLNHNIHLPARTMLLYSLYPIMIIIVIMTVTVWCIVVQFSKITTKQNQKTNIVEQPRTTKCLKKKTLKKRNTNKKKDRFSFKFFFVCCGVCVIPASFVCHRLDLVLNQVVILELFCCHY